jgi:hypothetical protein
MRNLKAVFIVTLLAIGMAQATWYWSPPSYVLPINDSARTGCGNARCIVGADNDIHVVFTRNAQVGGVTFQKTYSAPRYLVWVASEGKLSVGPPGSGSEQTFRASSSLALAGLSC